MTENHMQKRNPNTLRLRFAAITLFAILGGCATIQRADESATVGAPSALTARSPFIEPSGALSSAVHQSNIATTICVSGWTATVRPPTSYTSPIKRRMLQLVGASPTEAGQYELDHFVPLALGGSPTSLDNLWLQRWLGAWNARIKDRLERKLQVLVCAGSLSLQSAQNAIRAGWKDAYAKYVEGGPVTREIEPGDDGPVE